MHCVYLQTLSQIGKKKNSDTSCYKEDLMFYEYSKQHCQQSSCLEKVHHDESMHDVYLLKYASCDVLHLL